MKDPRERRYISHRRPIEDASTGLSSNPIGGGFVFIAIFTSECYQCVCSFAKFPVGHGQKSNNPK